jgi:Tfp pilus assembly protein PilF/TolB-like protein
MPTLPWPFSRGSLLRQGTALGVLLLCAGCATQMGNTRVKATGEIPRLEARIARDSANVALRAQLGAAYVQAGRAQDARPILEAALAKRPSDTDAMFYLGVAYEDLQLFPEARRLYEGYIKNGRSRSLRNDLSQRLALLQRRELEATVRQAVRREAELASVAPQPRTVAVFPFSVLRQDAEFGPLGRAVAEMLVIDLSQTSRLTVLERLQVQLLLDELKLSQTQLVDPASAVRSGRMLGAERIVQGSLGGQAQSLELNAAIVRAQTVARGQPNAPSLVTETDVINRVLDAEKRMALRIYQSLGVELTVAERELVTRRPTDNIRALLAYGIGLEAFDSGDYARAALQFEEALRLDPNFALARAKAEQTRQIMAAIAQTTSQLVDKAATEALQPGFANPDLFLPNPFARDAVAEILGRENFDRKSIIELIIRRPN